MKLIQLLTSGLLFFICENSIAQNQLQTVKAASGNWTAFNRNVSYNDGVVPLDAGQRDGLLWINNEDFKNGIIEVDIKGKDLQGQSFVGVAFHGMDNNTFDGVYFRPFNFKSPERHSHSVQYISMPDNDWSFLRNKYPGKYENTITPVPDPNDRFHARIVVNYPENIIGLSTGIAFTLLIGAYVWSELQVNTNFRNADRQYILQSKWKDLNQGLALTTMGPLLKSI